MPKQILKCRCSENKKCSAPLHGTIEIITCKKNCGLGCDSGSSKRRKRNNKIISPIAY
jgi:hypothetical protein